MNKILFNLVCVSLVFLFGKVSAQSFTPGMKVAEDVQNSNTSPSMLPEKNSLNKKDAEPDNAADSEDGGLIIDAVEKKIDGAKITEDEYDNSKGMVFQFSIVDGKVIFDDERKILISYDNYKVEKGLDGIVRCSMRIYVLNDLTTHISNLAVKLKWPEISTNVQMNKVNPGVKTYMDVMLLGDGCLSMDKTPTIEVNRCRVKGMSEEKCSDAIRWFKANQ